MKAWAIAYAGVGVTQGDIYWTGAGTEFSSNVGRAVCFARKLDAERMLLGEPMVRGRPVEVTVDEEEPTE